MSDYSKSTSNSRGSFRVFGRQYTIDVPVEQGDLIICRFWAGILHFCRPGIHIEAVFYPPKSLWSNGCSQNGHFSFLMNSRAMFSSWNCTRIMTHVTRLQYYLFDLFQ